MPDAHTLLLFVLAGWLLNLTPGPDVLCIVRHALREGLRAGMVAGLGVVGGCFVHVGAAALGLGVLLQGSATAFTVLKLAGAAYLCWIGWKALRAPSGLGLAAEAVPAARSAPALRRVFMDGFWTNVLNPKVALFFLAFLPQFIAPGTPEPTTAFLALGLVFNLASVPINLGWAALAAWLARRPAMQRGLAWVDRAAGVLLIGFGLRLAWSERP
jgi:threonine/homoserine/homoserine lactone efflux protein